ncbi:MAG TPA: DNA primase [Gemmataceae bacterium]|nr:DNA primase [Gemmataceae bacterium]
MVEDRASLTRQVKEASDIVAVVGSYLTVTPAGGIFKAVCPFHNDTRPSLQIDPKWQNFRCWSCGKKGDVFTFVSEYEKISFREARELLARRSGINLEGSPAENQKRGKLLDAVKWAEKKYQECLNPPDDHDPAPGERARLYLAKRKLLGSTVRAFGLGFAPAAGDWLVRAAVAEKRDLGVLQEVGLVADRREGHGFFDRFRDRLMFPIRDSRGQTVGFGGRILPDSPFAERGPKYYNSSETPLFLKKELLYGLDVARHAAATEGYLAVVEGYTDVMMAHQCGVTHVVATMGTALNEAHVRQLRRFVPKVVLVFDADEGGTTGVDRALEIFVGCDVELAIATLPAGMDPCDLLAAQGAEPFRTALAGAVDALDFKVTRLLEQAGDSVDGTRRVVEEVLGVMALAPEIPGQAGQVKQQLLITRLAHRLGLQQETVWKLFGEKKAARRREATRAQEVEARFAPEAPKPVARKPARAVERELLQALLAEPGLVPQAYLAIRPEDLEHPGLQQLLATLYFLHDDGEAPNIDGLRERIDNEALIAWALDNQEVGLAVPDRGKWFQDIRARLLAEKKAMKRKQSMERLRLAKTDEDRQRILREIQDSDQGPDPTPAAHRPDPVGGA